MSATTQSVTAAQLASITPSTRDRYVDLLRAVSIAVVVLGHWLMAVVTLSDGEYRAGNALEMMQGAWILTWVLQVMPLFFFVGGFANIGAWESRRRKGEGYGSYLSSRIERLLRPTLIFAAVWMVAAFVLQQFAGLDDQGFVLGMQIVAKPLWFLAVYLLVIAAAPPMIALHRRFGVRVLVALLGGVVVVDIARLALNVPYVGVLNFAFVWAIAHQLGFFYADGSLLKIGRKGFALMAGGGLLALVALTGSGVYSPSMVGVASERVSNNSPPSICIVAMSVWLIGLAMLVRDRVSRALTGRLWVATIVANSMIMTVFLWHLTVLMIAVPVAYALGFPQPDPGTAAWWLTRPVWIAILGALLAVFVAGFSRFERGRTRATTQEKVPPSKRAAVSAAALLLVAFAGLATYGFADVTSLSLLHAPMSAAALAAGAYLVRSRENKKGERTSTSAPR